MVMNMLTGILVDVVQQVAESEKEEAAVGYLKNSLLEILECHDKDNDRHIHTSEFDLLMRNPEMHVVLTRFGVNVVDLISLKDVLFQNRGLPPGGGGSTSAYEAAMRESQRKLSFPEFLEVVLRLRGGNSATVTDIVELREYVRQRLDRFEEAQPPASTMGSGACVCGSGSDMEWNRSSAASPPPSTASDSPAGAHLRRARTSLCVAYPKVGEERAANLAMARLEELLLAQREMAARQAAWHQEWRSSQAALAEELSHVREGLRQVQEAIRSPGAGGASAHWVRLPPMKSMTP